jgi:hypothetical protein
VAGWFLAILQLICLSLIANQLNASQWIMMMMGVNMCVLLADVPADGYSIELSKLDKTEGRGQVSSSTIVFFFDSHSPRKLKVLATGQFIRWSFSTLAGFFQAFLLNGPTTNTDDCTISWQQCWSWGLTVREYYGLLTICISLLFIPMCFLKESDPRLVPTHTAKGFLLKIWVRSFPSAFHLPLFLIAEIGNPSKSSRQLSHHLCCWNSLFFQFLLQCGNVSSVLCHRIDELTSRIG